jgi:hypothetical protein
MCDSSSSETPKPASRAEQVLEWVKKFIVYCSEVTEKAGVGEKVTKEQIDALFGSPSSGGVPQALLLAKVYEIESEWGDSVEKKDMSIVARVVSQFCQGTTATEVVKQTAGFVAYLESHDEERDKFFRYCSLIRMLIRS